MLVQKPEHRWETRPIDAWNKAKEVRAQYYAREAEAGKAEKKVSLERMFLIENGDGLQSGFGTGFHNCQFVHPNPIAAEMNNKDDKFTRECRAASEGMGFGRDVCGYHACFFGSMVTNRNFRGGEFPKRDYVVATNDLCNFFFKTSQQFAEYWDIPQNHTDLVGYYGPRDEKREEKMREYLVAQNLYMIEWLEKATGTKFDDEAYIEGFKRQQRTSALRAEVVETLQNVPTPLDEKSGYSLFTLGGIVRSDPEETEKLWIMIRDEMKWRAENKIAAVATERYRFRDGFPPPWYFLRFYRYMEEYGAVCVSANYAGGGLVEQPDGTFKRAPTLLERGVPLNTREDVIRAQTHIGTRPQPENALNRLLSWIKGFKCNGVVLQLQRAGIGCTDDERETAIELEKLGIPVMHYETSHAGSRTDFDENRLLDQLDTFMEMQGLGKLGD
jgi:benzoyl-CoA reductase subunit B